MILISVAAPQHLQYHRKRERRRRKAGDTYKRCGTATPTIPSEERERGEKLVILISVAAPQHLQYHQKREREEKSW